MTAIHVPGLLTFTIAILVFFAGAGLNRLIEPLRRWNIPEPVTGGLLAAAATLIAYVALGVEISFTLDARDMLLLYFFTGIGLNARLGDLISGGRPLLVLLALTLVYLVIQNLIAAGSVAALGLPKGITPFVGSASLIGGHGTTIAWAPIIAKRFGIANALEVGIATATLGLVVASLVGGPIAGFLIARHRLSGPLAPDPVVGLPDEPGGNFAPIEAPEFRQFGDERAQRRVADSRHAGQEIGVGLPGWAVADCAVDVPLEFGKLGLQEIDMPIDGLENAKLASQATAVLFCDDHLDDLTTARHQLSQRLGFGVRDGPGRRPYGFGEVSDRRGVEAIGLGEFAGRAGEIADLTRIDHRERQMRGGEGAGDHRLVSPSRLQRDQDRRQGEQALDKARQAFAVARDGEGLSTRPDANVQPILRHIDSDKQIHLPSLHMRARAAAPATVRDRGRDGWGAMLRSGLLNPRSARAPIRRRAVKLRPTPRSLRDTRSAEGASRRTFQRAQSVAVSAVWNILRDRPPSAAFLKDEVRGEGCGR